MSLYHENKFPKWLNSTLLLPYVIKVCICIKHTSVLKWCFKQSLDRMWNKLQYLNAKLCLPHCHSSSIYILLLDFMIFLAQLCLQFIRKILSLTVTSEGLEALGYKILWFSFEEHFWEWNQWIRISSLKLGLLKSRAHMLLVLSCYSEELQSPKNLISIKIKCNHTFVFPVITFCTITSWINTTELLEQLLLTGSQRQKIVSAALSDAVRMIVPLLPS